MKRWLSHLVITAYLGALFIGVASHAVSYATNAHPAMYFIVWDMFCGWSAFESRLKIIGEGETGRFYELAPPPWGEFEPFGRLGRQHYDPLGNHGPALGLNCLKHTRHEPMTRIFVVEESWAKKYNLPDRLWSQWFDGPKEIKKYYHTRHVVTPDGVILQSYPGWLDAQYALALGNNPRLQADSRRGRPFYAFDTRASHSATFAPGSFQEQARNVPVGSPLGE